MKIKGAEKEIVLLRERNSSFIEEKTIITVNILYSKVRYYEKINLSIDSKYL